MIPMVETSVAVATPLITAVRRETNGDRHGFTDTCFLDVGRPELSDLPIVFVVSPRLRFDRNVFYRAELE